MIVSTEIARWPNGRIRDEYRLLFGLRLGDFWLSLALIAGLVGVLGRHVWPIAWAVLHVAFGG